jgi:hypothetical protein
LPAVATFDCMASTHSVVCPVYHLPRRLSAIYRKHLAGGKGRLVGAKKHDRVGDLVGLADTAERWPSTTSAERRSSGSKKARARSSGPDCRAAPSPRTPSAYSSMLSPTISATSCETLAMPKAIEQWSLTSLREKLMITGAKVVSHGRHVTFQLAEVGISRPMFKEILMLIARLRAPPAPA